MNIDNVGLQEGMDLPKACNRKRTFPKLNEKQKQMVAENLWVATKISHKMQRYGNSGSYTQQDLEGVGFFALCVAVTRYDDQRNTKFSTYAWPFVKGWMQHAIRDHSRLVRLPRKVLAMRAEVKKMVQGGKAYGEIGNKLDLTMGEVALCETSWREEPHAIDLIQEDRKPLQLEYNSPQYTTEYSASVRELVEGLDDKDLKLLNLYVSGSKMSKQRETKAKTLYEELKKKVEEAEEGSIS